ncbi:MAG TPA: enoyl-CoA hydratase/isomerase family protein [Myxococcota bacterium]|nr:enoyl-CoA hydratase/isomerase family protein [Myxococcota bacterium]
MSDPAVLYEVKDYVATITLNRPENRNSMTEDVLEGLRAAVTQARDDSELRCVVVTGRGKSFCAGADFKSQIQRAESGSGRRQLPNERSFAMYSPFLSLLEIEVPVIGALNGHAIGGGLGLALVCDIRIANRESKYGANFTKLGLHPGMATTYFLPRLVGVPRAAELLFTGRLITGEEAAQLGLANYAVSEAEVLPRALAMAREVASAAPIAVRWTKRSLYQNVSWDPVSAARAEAHAQSRTLETDDSKEGVKALLEKREPVFRGR